MSYVKEESSDEGIARQHSKLFTVANFTLDHLKGAVSREISRFLTKIH